MFAGSPSALSSGPLPPLAFVLLLLLYSWNLSFCASPSLLVLTLLSFGFPNSTTACFGSVFVWPPSSLSLLPPSMYFLFEFEINQELSVYLCWPSAMLAHWKGFPCSKKAVYELLVPFPTRDTFTQDLAKQLSEQGQICFSEAQNCNSAICLVCLSFIHSK